MKKIYSYLLAVPTVLAMALSTSCVDPAPEPKPEPGTEVKLPTISLSEDIKQATSSSAVVDVTVTNADKFKYTYYVRGERPEASKIEWVEKKVEKDGEYEVTISDLPTNLEERTVYTFEAFACLKDSVSKNETCSFQTLQTTAVELSDIRVSAGKISAIAACLPEHCDGFFWKITKKNEYTKEQFLADCEPGEFWGANNPLVVEKAVIVDENATPGFEYIIAIQPVLVDETGEGYEEMIGDVIEIEIETLDYALSQKEVATVTFSLDGDPSAFGVKVKAERTADANVGGCYFGIVKKSVIGTKEINTYLTEAGWFYAPLVENPQMYNYDIASRYNEGDLKVSQLLKADRNVDYVVFVIPYDKDKFIGKAVAMEVKSGDLVTDYPVTATAVVTPDKQFATVDVVYGEGCAKIFWAYAPKGELSQQQAFDRMIENAATGYDADCWIAEYQQTSNTLQQNIVPEQTYDLYMLPATADYKFGAIMHQEFTAKSDKITFNNDLTMSFTVGAAIAGEGERGKYSWIYNCPVQFTSAGVTTYQYGTASKEDFINVPTAEDLAQFLNRNFGFMPATAKDGVLDMTEEITFSNRTDGDLTRYILFIPMDIDGGYGKPVMETVIVKSRANEPSEPGTGGDPKSIYRR